MKFGWPLDPKYQYQHVFLKSRFRTRDASSITMFFTEHFDDNHWTFNIIHDCGFIIVYTLEDSWQVVAKLTGNGDILNCWCETNQREPVGK